MLTELARKWSVRVLESDLSLRLGLARAGADCSPSFVQTHTVKVTDDAVQLIQLPVLSLYPQVGASAAVGVGSGSVLFE